MRALEFISFVGTADGGGLGQVTAIMTPFDFDSPHLRPSNGKLLRAFVPEVADLFSIQSQRFHDNTSIQLRGGQYEQNMLPESIFQKLHASDSLIISLKGDSATPEPLYLLLWYENIPNLLTSYIDEPELMRRFSGNLVTTQILTAAVPNAGSAYFTPTPVTQLGNPFKREKQYALLGYVTNEFNNGGVTFRGFCTGNLRVGAQMDGEVDNDYTPEFFKYLSRVSGLPTIPVMNGLDAPTLIVEIATSGRPNSTTDLTVMFAELEPKA